MGDGKVVDTMVKDGLWCAFNEIHMGVTAENIAERYGITPEEQDVFSVGSHDKAVAAIDAGRFKDEIILVVMASGLKRLTNYSDELHQA